MILVNKYNLKVTTVVTPSKEEKKFQVKDKAYTGPGYIFNSSLNDLNVQESILKTIEYLEKNNLGDKKLILD